MARAESSILHVDLDAFFAAVEARRDPSLVGKPVIVGGLGPRGVVSTANYEAREFGVHSAMAMAEARRRCPQAEFRAPDFEAYTDASRAVMAILHDVTELVEPLSLDEAFLDVAPARRTQGDAVDIARRIRAQVHAETGLVASVGVATTKMLAKIASDLAKPDGLLVVAPGTELEFLHPLPVARLWGVGAATQRKLDRLAVKTIGELAEIDDRVLVAALGEHAGRRLAALARNDDPRPVVPDREMKSIGAEETFAVDIRDPRELDRELVRLTDRIGRRVRERGVVARTIQLKIRFPDLSTITRAHTPPSPTDVASEILAIARMLLDSVDTAHGVRLLGVSAAQLGSTAAVQPALDFGEGVSDPRRAALERAADTVRNRYGDRAVRPAVLAPRQPDVRKREQ